MSRETMLDEISNWSYYDNLQHGKYIDENDLGYGPIKVFNSTVKVEGEEVFHGDISQRRFDRLKSLSITYNVKIQVYLESGKNWYTISKGIVRYYDEYKRWMQKLKREKEANQ